MRYADVMLLAAEAYIRLGGNLTPALNIINEVRERARNSTGGVPSAVPADLNTLGTPEQALNILFNERRLELAAEEAHRWYDLRRRHIAGKIDLTNWDFNSPDPTFEFR